MLKKLMICLAISLGLIIGFNLLKWLLTGSILAQERIELMIFSTGSLSLVLWFSDLVKNGFKYPTNESKVQLNSKVRDHILSQLELKLTSGQIIRLEKQRGKLFGLSPWNLKNWRSAIEITIDDDGQNQFIAHLKTKSAGKFQFLDFGENQRFLMQVENALTS